MPEVAKHCTICGRPLEIPCGRCHKPMPNGIDFCPYCGAKTEIRKIEEQKDEEFKKESLLWIIAIVIAVIICVIFPIVSIPVGGAAILIYQQLKDN